MRVGGRTTGASAARALVRQRDLIVLDAHPSEACQREGHHHDPNSQPSGLPETSHRVPKSNGIYGRSRECNTATVAVEGRAKGDPGDCVRCDHDPVPTIHSSIPPYLDLLSRLERVGVGFRWLVPSGSAALKQNERSEQQRCGALVLMTGA